MTYKSTILNKPKLMSSTKITLLLFIVVFTITGFSQERVISTFGNPTQQELTMTSYQKDPEATGVVLYEKGNNFFEYKSNYVFIVKEVHRKIKVLNAKDFNQSTIDIYLYKSGSNKEVISSLKAITHNGNFQIYVSKKAFYDIEYSENWTIKRFTFPNIKDGSVLEYTYTIRTPFLFNFGDWSYQGELPKIYSEFNSEIPGNYNYNRVVFGKNDLFINEASIKRNCFTLPYYSKSASCEVALYAMKDIPAFKEESYMLAKSNYISRVDYELKYYYDHQGVKVKFSKSWKDVDREFKYDKGMGRQLNNNSYFKNKIPENILSISDDLEKAKGIYSYIQDYLTWDGNSGVFSDARVKKAFDRKSGSSTEINLSLINALQAGGLDAKLVLHSTREQGLPATSYPVISDFNYVLVHLTINEEQYLLDATDKFIPFGMVPFRALNLRCRVMDFKEGSYWYPIIPYSKNISYILAQLTLEDNFLNGEVTNVYSGYRAVYKRKELNNKSESDYLLSKEELFPELEINNYFKENFSKLDKPLKEKYSIKYGLEYIGNTIYLYPFFLESKLKENPFKSNERHFPVNIGFPISNTYMLSIDLKNAYEVEQLPKSRSIELDNGVGQCKVLYSYKEGKINLRLNFNLRGFHFKTEEYQNLKEFYNQVVEVLRKDVIVLKKL